MLYPAAARVQSVTPYQLLVRRTFHLSSPLRWTPTCCQEPIDGTVDQEAPNGEAVNAICVVGRGGEQCLQCGEVWEGRHRSECVGIGIVMLDAGGDDTTVDSATVLSPAA